MIVIMLMISTMVIVVVISLGVMIWSMAVTIVIAPMNEQNDTRLSFSCPSAGSKENQRNSLQGLRKSVYKTGGPKIGPPSSHGF